MCHILNHLFRQCKFDPLLVHCPEVRKIQCSLLRYDFLQLCANTHITWCPGVCKLCEMLMLNFFFEWIETNQTYPVCDQCDRSLHRGFCCCSELNASMFSHRCELWCVFKRELQRAPIQVFNLLRLRPLCILLRKWSHNN